MAIKRSTTPTKIPGIPAVPHTVSPELRRYLSSLSEAVEIRLGRRGDQRDRAVTVRELLGSGLADETALGRSFSEGNSGGTTGITPGSGISGRGTLGQIINVDLPTAPTGFSATGGYEVIQLYWDVPTYSGHSLTEIWRHTSDVIGAATLLGVAGGTVYIDAVGENQTYYYWIRHVNLNAQIGPYNASAGTVATTARSVDLLLTELAGAITSSELATSLATPIGNLPPDTTSEINSLQSQINTLNTVAAWVSTDTYALDDLVTYNGNLYRSKSNGNTGNQPSGTAADTTYWAFVGAYSSLSSAVAGNTSSINEINYVDASSTSAIAQAVAALEATVDDPSTGVNANSTALTGLTTRVTTAENDITTNASGITSLNSSLTTTNNNVSGNASAITSLTTRVTTAEGDISSQASDITTLSTSVNGNTTSIQTNLTSINGLEAQYTVKIDANGGVAGFGLASTLVGDTTDSSFSEFYINADRFAIYRDGNDTGTPSVPFSVQTTATTLNGETVPAGVYIADGFIKNGSIVSAKIADATIDNAKIANLDAGKITTGELNANRISVDGATIVRNASGQLEVDELSANQIVAGTIDASVINVANLNASNITSGTITSGRIDVTDLLLPTGGGSVTGSSIGAFTQTNVAQTKLVTSIGTGLGYFQGYVRIVGGTNHLKNVRLIFATSNTSVSGNTVYTTPLTSTLPGHIDRFFSSSDSQNIPLAFVNSAVDGTIYLWVQATADSAPDEFGLIEARFLRFGTGSSVYAYGAWSSYQYSRTTAPLYYWRVNVQSSTDLLYWDNTTVSPITGGGSIATSTSIFAGDGYQYERGPLQYQEYDVTSGPEPTVFLKALYYNVRRRTYSSA